MVLAGLLRDISKLIQRGTFGSIDIRGMHPKISADFVSAFSDWYDLVAEVSFLKTMVQKFWWKYNVGMSIWNIQRMHRLIKTETPELASVRS